MPIDSTESTAGTEPATKRDFIFVASGALAAVGITASVWPFIDQMNPAADTRAMAFTDVDLAQVEEGQQIVVIVEGKPVFVRHRTPGEIADAQRDDFARLIDPQTDAERLVQVDGAAGDPRFLVIWSACTHLGCIPIFAEGDYYGWRCACHGSEYDTSGRVRRASGRWLPRQLQERRPDSQALNNDTLRRRRPPSAGSHILHRRRFGDHLS